jgi:hypothetical protein
MTLPVFSMATIHTVSLSVCFSSAAFHNFLVVIPAVTKENSWNGSAKSRQMYSLRLCRDVTATIQERGFNGRDRLSLDPTIPSPLMIRRMRIDNQQHRIFGDWCRLIPREIKFRFEEDD